MNLQDNELRKTAREQAITAMLSRWLLVIAFLAAAAAIYLSY